MIDAQKGLVSVIVPLYNSGRFIGKCLKSLLQQTYKNFEIIVVDNGSTDNSLAVAKEYQQIDERVKCFSCTDKQGVSAARNAGLRQSKGEYICFIDSDDYVSKFFLATLLYLLEKNQAAISCVSLKNCGEKQRRKFSNKFKSGKVVVYDKVSAMERLFTGIELRMNVWNKMYRRSVVFGNNTSNVFKEDIYHGEDVCFLYDAFSRAEKVVHSSRKLYAYTRRKGSLVHSKMGPKKLTYLDAVAYAADKCLTEMKQAYAHVAGWQVTVGFEVTFYMLFGNYFDYDAYIRIKETLKEKGKLVFKGKRQRLYRRIFAVTAIKFLLGLYSIRFRKKILKAQIQEKKQPSKAA